MNRFRWTRLFVLVLLVGAIVSVACGGEEDTLLPAFTPTSTIAPVETPEPKSTSSATLLPTEVAEPTEPPIVTSVPTSTPEPTHTAGRLPTTSRGPRDSSFRVLSSRAAAVPTSRLDLVGFRSPGPLPFVQQLGGDGGLTVSANGSVTVEADEAYVVVLPGQDRYGPSGPLPIDPEDRMEVTQNLVQLGFKEDDIEFEKLERYGPPSVSVEVEKGNLPEIGERVLDEVEKVLGRSEVHGVRFSLSEENCARALALARRVAIPKAGETALDLAEALQVRLGGVTDALEFTSALGQFGPPGLSQDRCSGQLDNPFAVLPFDAEAEVEVSVSLQITYAIE